MKYFFSLVAICLSSYTPPQDAVDPLIMELSHLAESQDMELVVGSKFPTLNPYGSYGSPYVVDFLLQQSFLQLKHKSLLFLCRKKSQDYIKKKIENSRDLTMGYDYFLVFAIKEAKKQHYKIQNIIPRVSLMGMSLYYGNLGMNLSQFSYIFQPELSGPKQVKAHYNSGCVPILISSETSTQILYYYEGEWLRYVEVYD